jgi:MFS family permease
MKFTKVIKNNAAILVGNFLDHYDLYIYTLLAPYIAKLFFNSSCEVVSLMKAYMVAHIGVIARPLGAIFFGRLASIVGPLCALQYSLIGVAAATCAIGLLPTYQDIGVMAPLLLVILRGLQSMFASGEGAVAGLYLVSNNPGRRSLFSSIYSLSTLLGMLLASKVSQLISQSSDPLVYWRLGFVFGFSASLVGIYIRAKRYKSSNVVMLKKQSDFSILFKNKVKLLKIAILCSFSYISYPICFVITNAVLPLIQDISIASVIDISTYLIIFDGLIICAAGYLLSKVDLQRFMVLCAVTLALLECCLLFVLPSASCQVITILRVLLIIVGVPFAVALKIWLANITDCCGEEKYLFTAVGLGFGVEILGRSIVVWSLYIFSLYANFSLAIAYVVLLAVCAIYSLVSYNQENKIYYGQ